MPTTLPDRAARDRHRRRRQLAEFAPLMVAGFYLLLLAWNMAAIENSFSALLAHDRRPNDFNGEYNPMEPGHGTQAGLKWRGWLAQR
jgi:hypothetical protein